MICPLLGRCEAQVNIEHYRNVCSNVVEDAYEKCDHYKRQASGTKTPLEWQKLLTPTA
jgi:hypothetical protein